MIQKLMSALDNGDYGCGVFIDLQKAFDTVDHKILLSKLSHYGIRGTALNLFKSYLSNRSQFVSINGVSSNKAIVKHGVPQGSVLGPLLFLIYINDLHTAIRYSVTHHFADDTNLINFNKSIVNLNNQMKKDLWYLWFWLNANKISLNACKTEYVLFKSPTKSHGHDFKLKIGGEKIRPSNHIKYLGVLIDSNLNFRPQINDIATKLKKANGILAKLRHVVPRDILVSIYYALFHSHLGYCAQIWGQRVNSDIDRIIALQNCAVRIMSFADFRVPTNPLYRDLGILKFGDLIHLNNALFVYSNHHCLLPSALTTTFAFDFTKTYPTRASVKGLIKSYAKKTTAFGTNSVKNQCIHSWRHCHELLPHTRLLDLSLPALKYTLKSAFLESY